MKDDIIAGRDISLMIELLEHKYIHCLKLLSEDFDIEKRKYFFIGYGLSHPEVSDYCLDFLDMFSEIERQVEIEDQDNYPTRFIWGI